MKAAGSHAIHPFLNSLPEKSMVLTTKIGAGIKALPTCFGSFLPFRRFGVTGFSQVDHIRFVVIGSFRVGNIRFVAI